MHYLAFSCTDSEFASLPEGERLGHSTRTTAASIHWRTRPAPSGFIEPCLPSTAAKPPSGIGWIHEIKHNGYRVG
jgi:ATP-dependent DNA ligase